MAGTFTRIKFGDGLDVTDEGAGVIRVDSGGGGDPAADTHVWMPLTTVAAGVPELVWDGDDSLIPTLTPLD